MFEFSFKYFPDLNKCRLLYWISIYQGSFIPLVESDRNLTWTSERRKKKVGRPWLERYCGISEKWETKT